MYGTVRDRFAHTWYRPAPESADERIDRATQRMVKFYDRALVQDDEYAIWFFGLELSNLNRARIKALSSYRENS
jgi:hypothetical protein